VVAAALMELSEHGSIAMAQARRAEWLERVEHLGREGLRVLACAMRDGASADDRPFQDLTFVGLIGLADPARADVPPAIRACREAGIRVIMVTGDHAVTARSIGRAVGLGEAASHAVEGRELARLRSGDRGELLQAGIFARVTPEEKLELVRAYQKAGEIVAMTGDGVNDAPALRQADIGVAMGLRGTDVARQAAAMILLDDAFPTIVTAVREGRVIFENIRRFAAYLMSCNLSEVLVIGSAILSGLPLPILPLQILYLNLVTDVFPAFALAMGEGGRDVLKRPPRDPKEPILGHTQWSTIILQSLGLSAATFGAMALAHVWLGLDEGSVVTVAFLTLAFAQLWHVFNMHDRDSGLLNGEVTRNPWVWVSLVVCTTLLAVPAYLPPLAAVLHLVRPDPYMWMIILGMSLAPLLVWQCFRSLCARRAAIRFVDRR
jgi:P-type Ca2+ transporter type 2C